MAFEIYFVADLPQRAPSAEIQFDGQRLRSVRFSEAHDAQVEFAPDVDIGGHATIAFPLGEFQAALQLAVEHLDDWLCYLGTGRRAEARPMHDWEQGGPWPTATGRDVSAG